MTAGVAARIQLTLFLLFCAAGAALGGTWPEQDVDWRTSPVDLSFLNEPEKPAGKRGFLRAEGDALVFGDGSPARFWGTNLTAAALFETDAEAVREQARRLSRLGFNLVRLHHHDSHWVKPNIFGAAQPPHTRRIDPAMQARIDWWIKCLKDEGLYVWLDLHVQRQLRAGDGVAGFEEIAKGRAGVEFKGYNYVNADIRRVMQRFNEAYLGHVNAHTGVAYKDEPAIVAVLLTNENDLTEHFANALLPDRKVPVHSAAYLREARAFAQAHGLPSQRVWRSWEAGPSKRFLNELEHRFNAQMIEHLRGIGVKVPIVTTNLWGGLMASLPALADGDMIDVHAYEATGFLARDPRRAGTLVHAIAAAQLPGKPLSVTEWNISPFPAPDRHVLPLYVAANASHQGWDALMQYAYAQTPLQQAGPPSNWHAFNDPALLAHLPAAALLFRQGHVQPAQTVAALRLTPGQLFDEGLRAGGTAAMRAATETSRLVTVLPVVPELPWLQPAGAPAEAASADAAAARLADPRTNGLRSDTGELHRDWEQGVFRVDTSRTQAALGRLGGRRVDLAEVGIALDTAQAGVVVQSLDDRPIGASRHLLVSVATSSSPAGPKQGPFFTEPAAGVIEIEAPPGLVIDASLRQAAQDSGPQLDYRDGRYRLRLSGKAAVPWIVLARPEGSSP